MWKAFGRGFDSRRLHHNFCLVFAILLFALSAEAQEAKITIFEGAQKTQIQLQTIEGSPYIRLTDLQQPFGLAFNPIAGNQSLSVAAGEHSIILSANRALVSVDGKLISLSQPVYVVQGEWFAPLDFISKVIKNISDKRVLWLESSRSLILGDVLPNQVALKYSIEQDHSRIVLQSVRPIGYTINFQNHVLSITPQSEDFVAGFQSTDFTDGILKKLTLAGKTIQIQTDQNYGSYKSFELVEPARLVIDFYRKTETAAQTELPPTKTPEATTLLPSTVPQKHVIVIDPGHGGSETGAVGPDGTNEKDVVLGIARKLKSVLENSGNRVILTRDGDQQIALDDRTALANNNKADLFISIHANATLRGYGKGAETYYLSTKATDDEARNLAAVENNAIGLNQEASGVGNDLKLILWDMAQTEYLSESSQLAEMVQKEMNETLGVTNRGIKQAPFRVLMGATMPAVLIEIGFINNPAEEKMMKDSEYQLKIAKAIFRSVQAFQLAQSNPVALQSGR
jgi:N-acetylmuramoyl-L-alanine amidase